MKLLESKKRSQGENGKHFAQFITSDSGALHTFLQNKSFWQLL